MTGWLLAAWLAVSVAAPDGRGPQGAAARAPAPARLTLGGEIRLQADVLPERDVAELRPEARLDAGWSRGALRARADTSVSALAADRGGAAGAAIARVRDAWIEVAGRRTELRAGFGTLVWGRLDEVQPSDVINPLDSARFFFHGRSDARRAVAFARARVFAPRGATVEAVLVPVFRRGVFDELDEDTSPFDLTADAVLPAGVLLASPEVSHESPPGMSGGARLTATIGRTDVSAAVYRGFDGFGPIVLRTMPVPGPVPALVGRLVGLHPRFTMVAGDFETVTGEWGIRGEVAAFVEKTLAAPTPSGTADGHVVEAGVGADRRWGESRLFVSVFVHREWSAAMPVIDGTDVSLVGSIERPFGRDRYRARLFGVVNPADASGFLRGLFTWSVRDDVAFEVSGGAFVGAGDDAIARFDGRDFVIALIRYSF